MSLYMNYGKKILGFKLQTNAGGLAYTYMHCPALPPRVNHTIL